MYIMQSGPGAAQPGGNAEICLARITSNANGNRELHPTSRKGKLCRFQAGKFGPGGGDVPATPRATAPRCKASFKPSVRKGLER